MLKRGQYVVLALMGALLLTLLNLPPSAASRLKLMVGGVFLPLFGLAQSSGAFVDDLSLRLLPRGVLVSKVRELESAHRSLALEAELGRIAREEHVRLLQRMEATPPPPWTWKMARVVGREPSTWWRTILIQYGRRDGAEVNQSVVTPEGLVGRISLVGEFVSHVALIGDVDSQVFAQVRETRDFGVIRGPQSTVEIGSVEWTALRSSPDVMAGHTLVTSGLGGVFPKGLVIGTVMDTRPVQAGLYTSARIRLAADLARLEEVWILLPKP